MNSANEKQSEGQSPDGAAKLAASHPKPKRPGRILKRLIVWPLVLLLLAFGYWQLKLAQRLPTPEDPTFLIPSNTQLYIRLRSPAELLDSLTASAFWRSWYWLDEAGKQRKGDPPWISAIEEEEERQEARAELAERRQGLFFIRTFGHSDLHVVLLPFPELEPGEARPEEERERWIFMTSAEGNAAEALVSGMEGLLRFNRTLREHIYKSIPIRLWVDEEEPGKTLHTLRLGKVVVFGMGTASPEFLEPIIDRYLSPDREGFLGRGDPVNFLAQNLTDIWANPTQMRYPRTPLKEGGDSSESEKPYFLCYSAAPGFTKTLLEGARIQVRESDPDDAFDRLDNSIPAYRSELLTLLWRDDEALQFVRRQSSGGIIGKVEIKEGSSNPKQPVELDAEFITSLIGEDSEASAELIAVREGEVSDAGLLAFLRFARSLLEDRPELSDEEMATLANAQIEAAEVAINRVERRDFWPTDYHFAELIFADNMLAHLLADGRNPQAFRPWMHLLGDLAGMRLVMELESRAPELSEVLGDGKAGWDLPYLEITVPLNRPSDPRQ